MRCTSRIALGTYRSKFIFQKAKSHANFSNMLAKLLKSLRFCSKKVYIFNFKAHLQINVIIIV